MKIIKIRYLHIVFIVLVIYLYSCTPPGYIKTKELIFFDDRREDIVKTAKMFAGSLYKEGGTSPSGFDCSGFTQYVYEKNEYNIPRKASEQYYSGRRIRLKSAKPGDLVFFRINSNRISHVGVYTGNFTFIHSPSSGKQVSFSSIKNPYWERRYVGSVTYFRVSDF